MFLLLLVTCVCVCVCVCVCLCVCVFEYTWIGVVRGSSSSWKRGPALLCFGSKIIAGSWRGTWLHHDSQGEREREREKHTHEKERRDRAVDRILTI